jgi:hypothetical protein
MVMIAHAQGQYAPEPVREYDPGDYLPPLYNAIKRSIQGAIDVRVLVCVVDDTLI